MSKRKKDNKTRYFYVSGMARKGNSEYRVSRRIKIDGGKKISTDLMINEFKKILENDGFEYNFCWGWSNIEEI